MTDEYPAINREAETLPILYIEVQTLGGSFVFDPNSFSLAAQTGAMKKYRPLPGQLSVISGLPAVVFRADNLRIPLTLHELINLGMLNLTPAQYFALRDLYGMAFDWHEDFYNAETGAALQPR